MHTQLLNSIKQVISLEEDDILFIKDVFHEKTFKKGDYFLREGNISREMAFVKEGLFYYYWNDDGEKKVFYFSPSNEMFGNYKSFTEKSPSEMWIECLEDAKILHVSYENLHLLFERLKQGQKYGRIIMERLFIDAVQALNFFYRKTPEERYLKFTEQYSGLSERIPQYLIASYIGVKPQSLSRIKKRMK